MRWNVTLNKQTETPRLDELTEKIIALCREYGVSLAHEDYNGAFRFEGPNDKNEEWLRHAQDATTPPTPDPLLRYRCPWCHKEIDTAAANPSCSSCAWRPLMELIHSTVRES